MPSDRIKKGAFVFSKLFPKEKDFFSGFHKLSESLSAAVTEVASLIEIPDEQQMDLQKIKELELQSEALIRKSIEHLHETFITPFDRRHIFHLVIRMGEVMSLTRMIGEKIVAYKQTKFPEEFRSIIAECKKSCEITAKLVSLLQSFKTPHGTLRLCLEIYQLRSKSEGHLLGLSARLYESDFEPKNLMRTLEVGKELIALIKKFGEVALLIEEIILEYA